jgi:phage terminase large subunit-like protein
MIKEQHAAKSKPTKNKRFKQSYGLNFACNWPVQKLFTNPFVVFISIKLLFYNQDSEIRFLKMAIINMGNYFWIF